METVKQFEVFFKSQNQQQLLLLLFFHFQAIKNNTFTLLFITS